MLDGMYLVHGRMHVDTSPDDVFAWLSVVRQKNRNALN